MHTLARMRMMLAAPISAMIRPVTVVMMASSIGVPVTTLAPSRSNRPIPYLVC